MDSLVGVDQWRDRSTGSVAREDTLLWEQTSFNVPIRETGMAPFLRVSKVRVHGSSITLNSTNVALSVNYIIIWVPSGDLPRFVYYFIFTRFCAPLPMPENISWCLGNSRGIYPCFFLRNLVWSVARNSLDIPLVTGLVFKETNFSSHVSCPRLLRYALIWSKVIPNFSSFLFYLPLNYVSLFFRIFYFK